MNCKDFNESLPEYLDGALGAEVQAAARTHLEQCPDCRRMLRRQEMVEGSIRRALDRATASLSVRPGMQRDVLHALESERAASNVWIRAWRRLVSIAVRPTIARAALLGILLLAMGIQFHRMVRNSGPQPIYQADSDELVIDVPMQTQMHVFEREDGRIVDAVAWSTSVGHGRFVNKDERRQK